MIVIRTVALACGILVLSSCGLFTKRDRPVDISKDAPSVEAVIQAVQDAIDSTEDSSGWQGSDDFKKHSETCQKNNKEAKEAHKAACAKQVDDARKACAGFAGATAPALCTDHLQAANTFCEKAPSPADECKIAEALAPITIKSARLKFSAAHAQEGEIGAGLKLVSASHTRKYGRTSSFEIELIPDPTRKFEAFDGGKRYNMDELGALLLTALNVGTNCQTRTTERVLGADELRGFTCKAPSAPQLILKKASFALDISYTQSSSGKIKWSVASLKLDDGTAGLSSSRTIGNTLTIELGRAD